jgi:hypothetical protein
MGWTQTYKRKGQSLKDFFATRFNYQREDGRYGKVRDCAATLSVAYLAYELGAPDKPKGVVALVCLLRHFPRDPRYNFGYKEMDESMGPVKSECPKRILKLLTPTDEQEALEWRRRCWDRLGAKTRIPKTA